VRRHLSLFGDYFLQYAKVRMGYRADFIISVITALTATVFGVAVVWLIFGRVPRLVGWSFYEILFLYGFSLLPMSLFNMVAFNLYFFSEQYIVEGKLDRVLLRPVNSLFQILFEQFRLEALGDAVLGIVIMVGSARQFSYTITPADWLFLAGAAVCGATIYMSVFLMLTCVSFWMEDRIGVTPPVFNMLTFGRYPLDIYSPFVKFFLSWILPFGFATFYPTASLLKSEVYGVYAWLIPVMTAVFLTMALLLWQRGIRSYSSTGT